MRTPEQAAVSRSAVPVGLLSFGSSLTCALLYSVRPSLIRYLLVTNRCHLTEEEVIDNLCRVKAKYEEYLKGRLRAEQPLRARYRICLLELSNLCALCCRICLFASFTLLALVGAHRLSDCQEVWAHVSCCCTQHIPTLKLVVPIKQKWKTAGICERTSAILLCWMSSRKFLGIFQSGIFVFFVEKRTIAVAARVNACNKCNKRVKCHNRFGSLSALCENNTSAKLSHKI